MIIYIFSQNRDLIQTGLLTPFWLFYAFVIATAQEYYEDDILEVDDGFTLSCEAASQFLFHFWCIDWSSLHLLRVWKIFIVIRTSFGRLVMETLIIMARS